MATMARTERFLRLALSWGIKALVGEHKLSGTSVAQIWHRVAYDIQTGTPISIQNAIVEERIARILGEAELLPGELIDFQRMIHNAEACIQRFRKEDDEE